MSVEVYTEDPWKQIKVYTSRDYKGGKYIVTNIKTKHIYKNMKANCKYFL